MLAHALTIVTNELNKHLGETYGATSPLAALGNVAEGLNDITLPRNKLYLSIVNISEEKSLKNLPNYTRNDTTLKATHQNPPVFLNFQILVTATDSNYTNALVMLSRAIRFFQARNVFTQDSVAPGSLNAAGFQELDQLESFKLIFDLYSPTMEEVNHLWGTLGGKQYPFVMYMMRMLDLQFRTVQSESGLITEVVRDFRHRHPVAN